MVRQMRRLKAHNTIGWARPRGASRFCIQPIIERLEPLPGFTRDLLRRLTPSRRILIPKHAHSSLQHPFAHQSFGSMSNRRT